MFYKPVLITDLFDEIQLFLVPILVLFLVQKVGLGDVVGGGVAGQEPGSNEEIAEFCRINHGVTFPLMAKTDVNGDKAEPIFEYLKTQAPTEAYNGIKGKATRVMLKGLSKTAKKDSDILWNFTKFLVNRDGTVIKRYAPITTPEDIEKDIQGML